MTTLLHLDASARKGQSDREPHGSHTRRMSARLIGRWREANPHDRVIYRDVGTNPPSPVTESWIHSAFTPPDRRERWMNETLRESDELLKELLAADVIVLGAPMYNFGVPAQLKAWVDNIVRVGVTFGFDRTRLGEPYWPLLSEQGKTAIIVTARGDYGYASGERLAERELVIPGLSIPLNYIGITDIRHVAIEYDEFADDRLAASVERAERAIDELVGQLVTERAALTSIAA